MIKTWRSTNADMIHAVCLPRAGESKIKMATTRVRYWILGKVSDIDLPIEAGDFKLLPRRAVNHLLKLKEKRLFLRD